MAIEIVNSATGAVIVDTDRFVGAVARESLDGLFDDEQWAARKQIVARAGAGRGRVLFVRDAQYYWAIRHYHRGGLVGKFINDLYLWSGRERTRAFAEWRLLHALRQQGLPVPTPVAARYVRSGLFYRADLITEVLPAVRTLADTITGAQLTDTVWSRIGSTIAKFHRAGAHHVDLNAHNVLLGEGGNVWILDFDRGRIRARGAWEHQVLARLHRSLEKIQRQRANVRFTTRDWDSLTAGYRKEA